MTKSTLGLMYTLTIYLVIQVLTKVEASKYSMDESYNDEEDNGKRRSPLAMGSGMSAIGEDYGDMSDSEYLRRAIRVLSVDVSSLRRTVRDLYKIDIAAIKKTVDRLVEENTFKSLQPNVMVIKSSSLPQGYASLLSLNNPGVLAGSSLGQGTLGIAQAGGGFGPVAGATLLRDELAQLVDANLAQQTLGQYGQTSSLQNQAPALGQLLSGYKENTGMNNGLGTGLSSAPNVPAQLHFSGLG